MINIQVKNHSTVVPDAEAGKAIAACQRQMSEHLKRVYGLETTLRFAGKAELLSKYDWQMIIADDADQADALGYHETTAIGTPIGYCFAKTTKDNGGLWSVTLSHELLELRVDPEITRCVLDEASQKLYSEEICDSPEDDSFAYDIDGVKVSDFVLPAFWNSSIRPHAPLSFTGAVKEPLSILPGGYLQFLDLRHPERGWQQEQQPRSGGHPRGSRLARRNIPQGLRLVSSRH